jgi:chromate reductase, NAD(P)H dehydrogenase (quinone)
MMRRWMAITQRRTFMEARVLRLVGFAGSLRRDSYNLALLSAVREVAPEDVEIDILDISRIPLYNADEEAGGDPAAVAEFKDAIRQSEGVVIATPEYNHGVPGVMKNLIDWASRPPRSNPLDGKPIAIMGASPGMTGTARAQSQLRQAFVFTNSYCMPQPEILVARCADKFDAEGRLVDEATRKFLTPYMAAVSAWMRRFRIDRPLDAVDASKTPR